MILQHLVIGIVGTIGNTYVILVYRSTLKSNQIINLFIIHLAHTDLICCLILLPVNCYHELKIGSFSSDLMCKLHSFLNIINITYSCQIMTLVSFERYWSIFHHTRKMRAKDAKLALSILFGICFIMGSFGFLSLGIHHNVKISSKDWFWARRKKIN